MLRRIIFTLAVCLPALLFIASCTSTPKTRVAASPADAVRASSPGVELRAGGGEALAEVRLDIAEGFHVNANPPTHPYLIATKLDVTPGGGVVATGEPQYPPAVKKKFAFDPEPLAVYEQGTTIKLSLRASGDAAKGAQTLAAKIRVQPCDDEKCYPPRTIETTIPVTVN